MLSESVLNMLHTNQVFFDDKITRMFQNCFPHTLKSTTELLDDGTTFVITGDIEAMWLRDSSAQVHHYLPFAAQNPELRRVIEGLIRRQMRYIAVDPYANAFNREANGLGHREDLVDKDSPWIWERKYEIDSLCYPFELGYLYWKYTGIVSLFDKNFLNAMQIALNVWKSEQNHENSQYLFQRKDCPASDTLANGGRGRPIGYTGLSWSGFRPSDDANLYGYNIPANMFLSVTLGHLREIARIVYGDEYLARKAADLRREIDEGILKYGIVEHPEYGKMFAYEVDGLGHYNLMDDANIPNLLSIPYIGYLNEEDELYRNTRRFVLSPNNPCYFQGKSARGLGSPHTPTGYIWHLGLIMQALTTHDEQEIRNIIRTLENTDAGTCFMHESFNSDDPAQYTRGWFEWANSLFSELILSAADKNAGGSGQ